MPATGERPEAYAGHIFSVKIGSDRIGAFRECSGPSVEMDVYEYEEGGNNLFVHKLPGRWKVGNVTLKRGVCRSDVLWDWCQKAIEGVRDGSWNVQRREITIELCSPEGETVKAWSFTNAYPVKWTAPAFNAEQNSVSVEELELAHEGLVFV